MKKILTLVLGLIMMAGCSSDDSGSSTIDTTQITKKWYYNTVSVFGQTFPYDDHENCGKDYIQFLPNGSYKEVDVWECEDFTESGTWVVNGNKITVTFPEEVVEGTILELTSSTLKLQNKVDLNEDGTLETVVTTFTTN